MSYSRSHLRKIGMGHMRPYQYAMLKRCGDRRILGHFHMPSHRERNHWKNYPPKMCGTSRMHLEYSVAPTPWLNGVGVVDSQGARIILPRS